MIKSELKQLYRCYKCIVAQFCPYKEAVKNGKIKDCYGINKNI